MQPDLPQTEAAIIDMTNAFRKANALREVRPNPALAAAARAFASYLARTGKFGHTADARTPEARVEAYGYRYCLVAENLALNLDSRGFQARGLAREAVEGWKASPGHRANLLLAGATEIGVAVMEVPDKHPKFVSVQLFGRPSTLHVTFSITNLSSRTITYRLGKDQESVNPREKITHTRCEPEPLRIEGTRDAAKAVTPRNGDRLVIRPTKSGGAVLEIEAE